MALWFVDGSTNPNTTETQFVCVYNPYTNAETTQLLLVISQEFHCSEAAAARGVDGCDFPTKVPLRAVKDALQCIYTNMALRNR